MRQPDIVKAADASRRQGFTTQNDVEVFVFTLFNIRHQTQSQLAVSQTGPFRTLGHPADLAIRLYSQIIHAYQQINHPTVALFVNRL